MKTDVDPASDGGPAPGKSIRPRMGRERLWTLAIVLAAAVLYRPTVAYMWIRWQQDAQYSLAYLVPFVSGYFVWRLWGVAARTEYRPSIWGLVTIVVSLLVHVLSVVLDVAVISDISILLFLLGGCLYLRGTAFTRVLWFPLAFTFFAVPIPEGIIDLVGFPLQLWATLSTEHLLQLLGIEAVRDGVNLSVPGFRFEVALPCSGMSSLVALVGVTAVFAYITKLRAQFRWVIFCLSLPIALAANVIRITTIALVGYEFGEDVAISMYHDWSSPMLFLVAIAMLFAISRGFEWLDARRTTR